MFDTEEHLRRILAQSDHPALKTIFDPSHFDLKSGSTGRPHQMLQRIGVKNLGYARLTDADGTLRDGGASKHLPCGDGHVDLAAPLRVLREGGFRGWIRIDAWEVPDPYAACVKGKRAIDTARGGSIQARPGGPVDLQFRRDGCAGCLSGPRPEAAAPARQSGRGFAGTCRGRATSRCP